MRVMAGVGEAAPERDMRRVEAVGWTAASLPSLADLDRLLPALAEAVPCDIVVLGIDHPAIRSTWLNPAACAPPSVLEAFDAVAGDYRLARHTRGAGDGRPLRVSDVMSATDYRRTAAYGEVFGPLGVERQLVAGVTCGAGSVCLAFNRSGRDFDERDLGVVGAIRPMLAVALRTLGGRAAGDASPLTGREAEILAEVRRGRSNKQIALRLGISVRTVQKHLEHVYAKLDVHNRTAASFGAAG
jgi:DNA-binding CsgD family transcriptional regulator